MDTLPPEVFVTFFVSLSLEELAKLRLTSKKFKEAIEYGLKKVDHISLDGYYSNFYPGNKYVQIFADEERDFLSMTRKVDPSFWKFISKYCGNSITLYYKASLDVDVIIPAIEKFKIINCSILKSSDLFGISSFDKLINIEELRIENDYECIGINHALERKKNGKQITHLDFSCHHDSPSCLANLSYFPVGIKSLVVKCNNLTPLANAIPKMSQEIAESLVEIKISGELSLRETSLNYSSLKKFSIYPSKYDDPEKIISTFNMLKRSSDHLESLTIGGRFSIAGKARIFDLIPDMINLKYLKLMFRLDPQFDHREDGSRHSLVIKSQRLKRLIIDIDYTLDIEIASKVISYIDFRVKGVTKFNVDPSRVLYFSYCKANMVNDVANFIKNCPNLHHLKVHSTNIENFANFLLPLRIENFPFLRSLEIVDFENPLILNDEIEEAEFLLRDVCLGLTLVIRTFTGKKLTLKRITDVTSLNFSQLMVNTKVLTLRGSIFDDKLLQMLTESCKNITTFNFIFPFADISVRKLYTPYIRSLEKLEHLSGSFSQDSLLKILKNFTGARLKLLIKNFIFIRSMRLKDDLHNILIDLVEKGILYEYHSPWNCCNCCSLAKLKQ